MSIGDGSQGLSDESGTSWSDISTSSNPTSDWDGWSSDASFEPISARKLANRRTPAQTKRVEPWSSHCRKEEHTSKTARPLSIESGLRPGQGPAVAVTSNKHIDSLEHCSSGPDNACDDTSVSGSDLDDLLMGMDPKSRGLTRNNQNEGDNLLAASLLSKRKRKKRKRALPYSGKERKRAKRKTAATPTNMTTEQEELLQKANFAYIERDISKAVELYETLIREAPGLHDPFHMLGLIYQEEFNNINRAVDYYMLAAHLVPTDSELWNQVGELSLQLQNDDQAIYCFRRCQRNQGSVFCEQTARKLTRCYLRKRFYPKAALQLSSIFERNKSNYCIAHDLAFCLSKGGASERAISVLETVCSPIICSKNFLTLMIQSVALSGCINMLAELLLVTKNYSRCQSVIQTIVGNNPLEAIPLDILISYAIADLNTSSDLQIIHKVGDILAASSDFTSVSIFIDRNERLITAYAEKDCYKDAESLYRSMESIEEVLSRSELTKCVATALVKLHKEQDAALILEKFITMNKQEGAGVRDAEIRLMLSNLLQSLQRFDEADEMLLSVSYKELRNARTLPRPIPFKDRQTSVHDLCVTLLSFGCAVETDLLEKAGISVNEQGTFGVTMSNALSSDDASSSATEELNARQDKFIDAFLHFVRDVELDTQRAFHGSYLRKVKMAQHKIEQQEVERMSFSNECDELSQLNNAAISESGDTRNRPLVNLGPRNTVCSRKKELVKAPCFTRLRADLELVSLEDNRLLGWASYAAFISHALSVFVDRNRFSDAIEILETILSNKRQDRTHTTSPEKQRFRIILERQAYRVSVLGELHRMTLVYTRNQYAKTNFDERILALVNRCLFTGTLGYQAIKPLSSSAEKDIILENRSWCIRHLLQYPRSYGLTMIAAHFCALSGRWPFAMAEYARAQRLLKNGSLPALCLAVSYLNFTTSRVVANRHSVVLRGLAALSEYIEQHSEECTETTDLSDSRGNAADSSFVTDTASSKNPLYECLYNASRACHSLGLTHFAHPLYHSVLLALRGVNPRFTTDATVMNLEMNHTIKHSRGFSKPTKSPLFNDSSTEDEDEVSSDVDLVNEQKIRLLSDNEKQLLVCSAHNLSMLLKERNLYSQSRKIARNNIVWTVQRPSK